MSISLWLGTACRRHIFATAIFFLLAVVHTYPLITGLDHLSRHNDDEWLNAWTVSWIAQQLWTNPLSLFDANIYYPHEQALAYTEPLLVPGVIGMPIHWLGVSPLLTYNVLLLLGMTLTGLAMYVLVFRWTGDHWSGLLSGAILAFGTPMLTRLPHLQTQHFYWLPLALLAFDNLLTKQRTQDAVWVGICVLGAALTSGYTAVFVVLALGATLVARNSGLWTKRGMSVVFRLAVVASLTLLLILLVLSPYRDLQVARPLASAGSFSAAVQIYLSSATYVHFHTWAQGFYEQTSGSFFPGAVAVVLALVALWGTRVDVSRSVLLSLFSIGIFGFVLSLGTVTPVYGWVYDVIPPFQSLRAPNRFAILPFFSVAVLAGIGFARLRRRISVAWVVPVSVAVIVVATVEGLHGVQYRTFDWHPRIYQSLGELESGPVAILPVYHGRQFNRNARYLLGSTAHWRPMVKGFGNSRPPDFDQNAAVISWFPSLVSVARLQELGVQYVIVHTSAMPEIQGRLAQIAGRSDVTLVAQDGTDRLYRINDFPEMAINGVLRDVQWSEVTYVERPGYLSYLGGSEDVGPLFGLQRPEHVLVYIENTTERSSLDLRLPKTMRGRVYDATTGDVLREVVAESVDSAGGPVSVALPPDQQAVILELRTRD
ncbi:MAG: hypothetical protein VX262_09645 [Acidobacteriota bacterium]|nr:hypothetical protein [Acidobacteriota bacterium]